MPELKQSTVTIVKIGPFVGTTGTVLTSLTIPQAGVRLSKAGGNMAQKSTATACVHDEIGVFFCDLSAADTDTLGRLRLDVDESGSAALAVFHIYDVVTAQYWDTKYGAGRFEVDVQEIDGASAGAVNMQNFYDGTGYVGGNTKLITTPANGSLTAGVFAADAITAGTIANGAIDAATFAADAIDAAAIAGSALVAASFAKDFLTADKIADDAIAAEHIAGSALVAASFAAGALVEGAASATTIAANALGASATTIAGACSTALSSYDGPTEAEMNTAHALLATPAQVNTEMLDVLVTDTFAEPGQGAPGATISLKDKIGYGYKFTRNKIISGSAEIAIYNDDGTTKGQKSTISDDGNNFTRGEFGSGA